MYVEFLPRLRRDIDAGKIHAKAYTRTQPLFGPPRRSLDKPSLREQLMSNPEKALPTSPRAISIACALVTWAGVQIAGVGLFDRVNFHSEISQTLLTTGALLFVGGLIGLSLIRLRGPLHAKKLWFLTIGLTPLTLFPIFIVWRIFFSLELIDDCDEGDAIACRTVAATRVKRGKTAEGIELYKKGCALDDARSCRELGGQAQKFPDTVEQSAQQIYAKACELGDAIGCNRAGQLLRKEDPTRAREFFSKACEMDYVSSCSEISEMDNAKD